MSGRKAIIPVAGYGTRFLPATRSISKMMIPVLDRPAIHFAVEEATRAGIEHGVGVVSRGQEAVSRYFDRIPELEQALASLDPDHLTPMEALVQLHELKRLSKGESE